MTWRAVQVPTGIHDTTVVRPIMEGTDRKVMEHFGSWKNGDDTTPLGKAKGIVIQDEQGRNRYAASRDK